MNKKNMNMNNPLFFVEDPEVRKMRIETTSVYPRSISEDISTGSVHFVLPTTGKLSRSTSVVLPLVNTDPGYQLPSNIGILALVRNARLTLDGQTIAEFENRNEFAPYEFMTVNPEHKNNVVSVLNGVNFVFETGSGSKLDNDPSHMQCLPGQYRLACDEYVEQRPDPNRVGRKNQRPFCMDGRNRLKITTDPKTTAVFSVSLGQLFPKLFGSDDNFSLPLYAMHNEFQLDIYFSRDGSMENGNERCVFLPSLSEKEADSLTAVATVEQGEANDDDTDLVLYDTQDGMARLLVDIVGGKTTNVRVLDGGRGYIDSVDCTFNTKDSKLTKNLKVVPAQQFAENHWSETSNFFIDEAGDKYEVGSNYTVTNPMDGSTFQIQCTSISGGGDDGPMTNCKVPTAEDNAKLNLASGAEAEFTVEAPAGGSSAKIFLVDRILELECENAAGGGFAVGNVVQEVGEPGNKAVVLAIDGNNLPTKMGVYMGAFADGDHLEKSDDNTKTGDIKTIDTGNSYETVATNGLGLDPIYNFENYDSNGDVLDDAKLKVHTPGVFLLTDLLYFMDGSTEQELAQINSKGLPFVYTQMVANVSSLTSKANVADYGSSDSQQFTRYMNLSNSVVRNVFFHISNSGTYDRENMPYYGMKKHHNALLNKYHARSSLVQDGFRYNLTINSKPYYANEVQGSMRAFRELDKCFPGKHFFVNKGMWMADNQCRQLDNDTVIANATPTLQPGFCDLDDAAKGTKRYEINERKSAIANQGYGGVDQAWLRGQGRYNGVSLMTFPELKNVQNNGYPIGATPVDMNVEFYDTYDSKYSGTGTFVSFAEIERKLAFYKGEVVLQTASFS